MFSDVEVANKKKFISLYEDYLANPSDEEIRKKAEGMGAFGGPQFSKEINLAASGVYKLETGRLSIEEAKKILEELRKA
jgi:predicted CopG family antitoxin